MEAIELSIQKIIQTVLQFYDWKNRSMLEFKGNWHHREAKNQTLSHKKSASSS